MEGVGVARVLNLYFYFRFVKSGCPFGSDGRINCNSNLSDFGKSETILTGNLMQKAFTLSTKDCYAHVMYILVIYNIFVPFINIPIRGYIK